MDIASHALAGACMGAAFGRPLLGAVCAILPDLVLPVKRITEVTTSYTASHSLLVIVPSGVSLWVITGSVVPLLALLSHILLDIPTHSKAWAPALFFPLSSKRYSLGPDWEFFNASWCVGLTLTCIWSFSWLMFAV